MTMPPPLGSGNCIRMKRPEMQLSTPGLPMVELFTEKLQPNCESYANYATICNNLF